MEQSLRDLGDGCRWVHRPSENARCVLNPPGPDERDRDVLQDGDSGTEADDVRVETEQGAHELTGVVAARYRHYKGGQYLVVGWGRDANWAERRLVFYVQLSGGPGSKLWARDRDDFFFQHMHRAPEDGPNAGAVWECRESCPAARERHEPRFRLMRRDEE